MGMPVAMNLDVLGRALRGPGGLTCIWVFCAWDPSHSQQNPSMSVKDMADLASPLCFIGLSALASMFGASEHGWFGSGFVHAVISG